MQKLNEGYVIHNEYGGALDELGLWDGWGAGPTEGVVHPIAVVEAVRKGGASDWDIAPSSATPVEESSANGVRVVGDPIDLTVSNGLKVDLSAKNQLLEHFQTASRSEWSASLNRLASELQKL